MVISVLERRTEIGLRRALGATRGHVGGQFFVEALLLSAAGGLGGVLLGSAATLAVAHAHRWPVLLPPGATAGGLGTALVIGAVAGFCPHSAPHGFPRQRPCAAADQAAGPECPGPFIWMGHLIPIGSLRCHIHGSGKGCERVIEVSEYDEAWAERAEAARAELLSRLPGLLAAIEHIGSTSVPGLAAKPRPEWPVQVHHVGCMLRGHDDRGDTGRARGQARRVMAW
jgi:FtsX-like permease family/GrpB protein